MNFSVSLSESFVVALAQHILAKSAENPQKTAKMLVLLPSRRACRSLREACLEASGGKPMLLPRMMPIGEISDEADFSTFFDLMEDDTLPAIASKKRMALLMRLIRRFEPTAAAKSYKLAGALCDLLDEVIRHQLDFSQLESLVPNENLAKHWQKTLHFLKLITQHWPAILAEEGVQDCTQASHERIMKLAKAWKNNPPDFPVIAAGSTGSLPATAELLTVISQMPQGEVILPGLDGAMSDAAWECLDATHPQYVLKQLLKKMQVKRKDVALLASGYSSGNASLRAMFTPAELAAGWSNIMLNVAEDMRHIQLMEAATQLDEARMIALVMREALEIPEKTVAFVTPDRALARKVAAQLKRYDIAIDDSAGTPLSLVPAAVFLRLINDVVETDYSPVALLALLRHPLASVGVGTTKTREYSRIVEHTLLRGIRFDAGMDSLIAEAKRETLPNDLVAWLVSIRDALRPLELLWLQNQPYPYCRCRTVGR
jgi:ATP-dependent helicase/nuclease subunit B